MTKEDYIYFSEKDSKYLNKARLFYILFIAIFLSLIAFMFIYQIYSYFVTMLIIFFIMTLFYRFVFYEYIYYVRKHNDLIYLTYTS